MRKSMIGKIYKNLKVLRKDENNTNKVIVLCLVCNEECSMFKSGVCSPNKYESCLKCSYKRRSGKYHHSWKGSENIHGKFMYVLKRIADKRKLDCSVNIDYLDNLLVMQKSKCALSGLDISLTTDDSEIERTASLDRIDSSKGYIEGNVQWVHKEINKIKQNLSQDRFIELCNLVSKYNEDSSNK